MRARIALAAALALAGPSAARSQDLTLVNGTVIDGTGAAPVPGMTIVVRGGKIADISKGKGGAGGSVIDLGGRWVLPGLIDAHAHFITPEAAELALKSGVTTARILGDQYFQGVGVRDLVRAGVVSGPEMLVSAGHVRPKLGTAFIVSFPQFGRYYRHELHGAANVAEVVRAVLDRGADVVKVGASERAALAGTDPRRQELNYDEIGAAVGEATKRGKFVAAHAHDAKGAHDAVRAGVRSIEHGTYITDETLRLMKERGTFLVPTLAVMSPLGDPRGLSDNDIALSIRTRHMQSAIRAMVRKAHALGIAIAAATDGTYSGDETAAIRVQHDMEIMRECGMTPMEAIVAGTQTGARVLGVDDRTGTLAVGKEADLLVFDRNPLDDFVVLFEPLVVVSDGRVVQNRIY
ncbi:MAG TPA: amidohydrolase family protein [Gemmatimonadales bacterium]|jgi:imidazolonepropionase-like amidohydrolase|nr:amidohydrolase family protein [Gemmatimonadales bacterium]